jgi:glucose-1-phosphate thymidylyltransferase
VIGVCGYSSRVSDIIKFLGALGPRELEVTDVATCTGRDEMSYGILHGWWTEAGTFDSLPWTSQLVTRRPDDCNGKVEA